MNSLYINLGFCYVRGIGVVKDENQAVAWYQKAADQGNKERAQYCLGVCYKEWNRRSQGPKTGGSLVSKSSRPRE